MGQQEYEQITQNMSARNRLAKLFQQRLQKLFRGLLEMEAALVMKGFSSPAELCGEPVVGLGFSHPLGG